MAGWLVLRDLWKDFIICDDIKMEIEGGFRGFKNVPAGSHTVENYGVKLQFDIGPDEVKVYVLNTSDKVFNILLKEDDDFGFHELAKSGSMDHALEDWPSK